MGLFVKAKSQQAAWQTGGRKRKLPGGRVRQLRGELAAQFRTALSAAGGVSKRLAELQPKTTGKAQPARVAKAQKHQQKRALSAKLRKRLAFRARKNRKKEQSKTARASETLSEALVLLGQPGGPLEGQTVRLVDFGLPDLLRNSPAVVLQHHSTGVCQVRCASGTERCWPDNRLYRVTGAEKLSLPEDAPDMRTVGKLLKEAGLSASGGQLTLDISPSSLLESPEMAAAWSELGARADAAGDVWPADRALCFNAVSLQHGLDCWNHSPGSPESQQVLFNAQWEVQSVLANPMLAAFVCLPLCAAGHWTLLSVVRQPAAPGQEPNKLEVVYRDSLPIPSQRCQQRAALAFSFVQHVFGADQLAQAALPAVAPSAKQPNSTSCGFYVLNWIEEHYRLFRGEGEYRLPEKFTNKAASLHKWFKACLTAKSKPKVAVAPAPLPATDAPPLPPPALPPPPLPGPQPPLTLSGRWGCSRCRHNLAGCDRCNPENR